MEPASFNARLAASAKRAGSWLCVGLDPDPEHYPAGLTAEDTLEFLLGVVEATASVACAVKPNAAFFEALGAVGHEALYSLVERIPPGLPIILDGKRNDIGNTATKYAEAAFDDLGVDAVTVTPYLGKDTVEPFADYVDKGVFLLARTSNASAGDFQDLVVSRPGGTGSEPLYQAVARKAMEWNADWGNLGLVAGATYPDELARLRTICGDGVPLLIPGVGVQGADARTAIRKGGDSTGGFAVVNVGRGILQAGKGDDWRDHVVQAAERFAADLAPLPAGANAGA
ncbi:MAG TPA: orotidine-5'-phosphate decarboxylase [Candidatus Thermoplasmatota archaeon]|nr:orotidine-5'-phosphate decarboxylase [Candidatus Thermoplasmatota archaeon]